MSKAEPIPKLVTALYSFKGKNNDELCFKKGDVITITQIEDGGWWEGTLNDKTGWFPSNYVKEFKASDGTLSPVKSSPEKSPQESPIHQQLNREIVLKDIVESERSNVNELQGLVNNFLQPLELSNILKAEDYKQLIGNIHEVLEAHQRLLANLENALSQGPDARVGNLFLSLAPWLKSIHTSYCNCHPQAVCILDKFRDELNEFMERSGAVTPGILVLTTGLSKPFRRLDKYSALLQELERYTEKNHSDRGDTQRSIAVFREIAEQCVSIRKQRELCLQVLTSGIKGWEGEELNTLGEILHVGPVCLPSGVERRDRYFVLFSSTLLVLSTSQRMSSFVYEGKLPLTGINVVALDDTEEHKSAFEISGPMIETILVVCSSKEDRQRWMELLSQDRGSVAVRSPTIARMNNQTSVKQPLVEHSTSPGIKTPWSLASLRPAPPVYTLHAESTAEPYRSPRLNERQFEDDMVILKIIEGYCTTVSSRFTMHSAMLDCEPLHKKSDKVGQNRIDKWDAYEDRTLSETVKTLKSQITDLQVQMSLLSKQLDEERRSRLSLAATVKRTIGVVDNSVT